MKIDIIVGARPNFVKAAAILEAAKKFPQLDFKLIHTGQHKSLLSDPFFAELGLPVPERFDFCPDYGSLSATRRFVRMQEYLNHTLSQTNPNCVMVVGDTDSTLAGAIIATKRRLPVVHVEAGLRCGDMKMQEEINRILVDSIAARHYTTSRFADSNLRREGKEGIFVGNVMIDTLVKNIARAKALYPGPETRYAVFTLHREENVNDHDRAYKIIQAVEEAGTLIPVIWPAHPRYVPHHTDHITVIPPAGYLEFLALLAGARFVMTDSGGVQEEATALGVPCLTLRDCTERLETVHAGTNFVVGSDYKTIIRYATNLIGTTIDYSNFKPEGYDGHSAERLLEDLCHATL